MFHVISFLFPLIYLLLFTASLVLLTRKSFGKCLPLCMVLTALLLFVSQIIFNTFSVGFVMGIIFALVSIPLYFLRKQSLLLIKQRFLTSGFVAFLLLYVLVFVFDINRGLHAWDELSHWGMMVKEMFRLDNFYSVTASNLTVHKDYPPIMSLFELFWIKLCGRYSEPLLERALHTFELAFVVPFLTEKLSRKKDTLKSILSGFFIIFASSAILLFFDYHCVFDAIYTDYVMAIATFYSIYLIFSSEKITWFEVSSVIICGCFLVLLKQMGLPLYIMTLVSLAGVAFIRRDTSKKLALKKLVALSLSCLVPFVAWFIWSRFSSLEEKQFDTSSLTASVISLATGHAEAWQKLALVTFVKAIGTYRLTTSFIQLSLIQCLAVFIAFSFLISKGIKNKTKRRAFCFNVTLLLFGAAGYTFAMMLLYATSFGPDEGPRIASYDRYMDTYLILLFLFLFAASLKYLFASKKTLCITIIAFAILLTPESIGKLYPDVVSTAPSAHELLANDLKASVEENSTVYFISKTKGPEACYQYFVQYYVTPIHLSWHPGNPTWHSEYWDISEDTNHAEQFEVYKSEIEQADYVLLLDIDTEFDKYYSPLLGISSPENGQIYRVIKDSDGSFSKLDYLTTIEHF